MMMKMRLALISICWLVVGKAIAVDHRDDMLRRMGIALVEGQCSIVFQKQYQVTVGGGANGSYIADNKILHQCQYVQEMTVMYSCFVEKTCPTYEDWSKKNPEFSASMPRAAFIAELEKRQSMVSALRAASMK